MDRVGNVFYNDIYAGKLKYSEGMYSFKYDEKYLLKGIPLSFNLPLQKDIFESEILFAFFENLVSEGWLRHLQSQILKIDEKDKFGLLLVNGQDLVGAVTIIEDKNE